MNREPQELNEQKWADPWLGKGGFDVSFEV